MRHIITVEGRSLIPLDKEKLRILAKLRKKPSNLYWNMKKNRSLHVKLLQ